MIRLSSLVAILIVFAATCAAAQGIQKWKTKDGKVVYGNEPPEGAEVLEEYEGDQRANTEEEPETASPGDAPTPESTVEEDSIIERRRRERAERRASRPLPPGVYLVGDTTTAANQGGSLVSFCYRSTHYGPVRVFATVGARKFNLGIATPGKVHCASVDVFQLGYFRVDLTACDPDSPSCRL